MRKMKILLYKIYIHVRYILQYGKVENMALSTAKRLFDDFYPQEPPQFKQKVDYNPSYDLMIIVPVYNTAIFLDKCIQSLLGQKTKYSYKIVFVDDGSTDQSGIILDSYNGKENVEIIHKQNSGISGARNYALKNICGRYIMFVDSDDLLADNAIELLMDVAIEKDADIVEGAHKEFTNDEQIDLREHTESELKTVEVSGYPWGKVISAEKMFNLCFPEGYLYEDTIIATLLLPSCKVVCSIPNTIYYYRKNMNSVTAMLDMRKVAIDTLYMTYYCFEESAKRGNELYLEDFLKQVRLNWLRTQNMPEKIQKAIFVVESEMINKYFSESKFYTKGALKEIEKVLRKKYYYAYKWLMTNFFSWS